MARVGRLTRKGAKRRESMLKKRDKLVYDPLYRMKPKIDQPLAPRHERAKLWNAVVRILSLGLIRR
jgi:hypothetical protein